MMKHVCNAAELPFSQDPTKTKGIKKRWQTQYNKKFTKLKGVINRLLIKGDEGLIPVPSIVNNQLVVNEFEFTSDAQSVARFMAWLELQMQNIIFEGTNNPNNIWQNKFIDQSYARGIERSNAEIKKLGITRDFLQKSLPANIVGTATSSLGVGLVGELSPIHLDAIQLLYIREFDALKGITNEVSKQISRAMVEGIEQGLGIRDIAKGINNRVDKIGITRSRLLARTETARAYNMSTINHLDSVTSPLGIVPMYQWITAGDGEVRPEHRKLNKEILTKEEAQSLIGDPNCRCALKPYIDRELLKAA